MMIESKEMEHEQKDKFGLGKMVSAFLGQQSPTEEEVASNYLRVFQHTATLFMYRDWLEGKDNPKRWHEGVCNAFKKAFDKRIEKQVQEWRDEIDSPVMKLIGRKDEIEENINAMTESHNLLVTKTIEEMTASVVDIINPKNT